MADSDVGLFGAAQSEPSDFQELFRFYQEFVKVFYSTVQSENELPVEILFELNAALDHVSRHYIYGESEEQVVEKAYSHLKRSCLDGFKIVLRETLKKAEELERIDISLIDNGNFEKSFRTLLAEIKSEAVSARSMEGSPLNSVSTTGVPAFDRWLPVVEKCLRLDQDFYLHESVDWARRKGRLISWKALVISSVLSGIIGTLIGLLVDSVLP